jgi:RNA polymerase sigma-70 factor (family 1)
MTNISRHIDQPLAQLVAKGDKEAFRELFDKYRNKVFSIAWKFTPTEASAEDIMQDVFIKLWRHKEKLANIENLNAYLNAVVRNHIFNYLRKVAHEHAFFQKMYKKEADKNKADFDTCCYKELETLVHTAVCQLPPQQKRVYTFSRIEGLKHEEIAERMGISRSTVKGHMVEALNHIRNFLSANGEVVSVVILLLLI